MNVDAFVNIGGALAAVALGAWMTARTTSRTTARAEAKAEHDALGAQFEAMVVAVAGLRAAVEADRVLWSNWTEGLRRIVLAGMTGLAPAAFVRGSERRQIAAFAGGAGWFLVQERVRMKAATASVTPKLEAVVAAAAPLMRHPDAGIREATERFRTAVCTYHESQTPEELEAAAADFGSAVRAVLHPPPRRRLSRRRSDQ
ncbi:hypothetical protein [Streptomyces spiralis]|uniref:hypothetical protein n=1 Tax=Streptomyces spiralis TaxID=66376 RepID=UPI0034034E8B